eukprot:8316739-Alexandrium_andersonii.AAC.1
MREGERRVTHVNQGEGLQNHGACHGHRGGGRISGWGHGACHGHRGGERDERAGRTWMTTGGEPRTT